MSEAFHTHAHDHDHEHGHTHEHGHAHDHHHHDGDTYYLDQICMIGVSAAFGAICLAMYLSNALSGEGSTPMLAIVLAPQFHAWVLGSGIILMLFAMIRGVALWRQAAQPAHTHDHDHCECDHEHGTRDLAPVQAIVPQASAHAHHHHDHAHHDHHHGHDHGPEDHDHGWAPWRYVLLLVPIILFLLGLPNKGPEVRADVAMQVDPREQAAEFAGVVGYTSLIGTGLATPGQFDGLIATPYLTEGEVRDMDFKSLLEVPKYPAMMEDLKGKTVRVRGQFAHSPGSDNVFGLIRFQIGCCGADAIPIPIPVVTRESIAKRADIQRNDWVKVTGVVDFIQESGAFKPVIRVSNVTRNIEKCKADSRPYIQ